MKSYLSWLVFIFSINLSAYCPNAAQIISEPKNYRLSARHIERGGIGYNHGYTTIEGFFAPNPENVLIMPFLDLRLHVFDNGKIASNIGLGARGEVGCRIYGMNFYYDHRNTERQKYSQMEFGGETLGNRWDFRVNGYFPISNKITSPYDTKFIGFSGHNMMISQKYQFAMKGCNLEMGFHLAKSQSFDCCLAAGTYYFTQGDRGSHIWGGKARLSLRYKDYIALEYLNSYDKMFHNRSQFQITLTLPWGGGDESCIDQNALSSRMVQPVIKQEIIVVGCKKTVNPAIDPTTKKPYNFIFVDNESHSSGTYESPYPTLQLAQDNSNPGDIIYVYPGDGTTKGMDQGITLKQNQKFWGSGINHAIKASQGTFIIPAQSSSAPQMTNIAGDGITLASGNQVSGFSLANVTRNGMSGTNVANIEISDCTLDNSALDQIYLQCNGTYQSTTLKNISTTNTLIASNNAITINSSGFQNTYILSDLSIDKTANNGIEINSSGYHDVANLTNLNIANSTNDAIYMNSTGASMTGTVDKCTIQGTNLYPVQALFNNQGILNLTNNIITNNTNGNNITFNGRGQFLASGNDINHTSSPSDIPIFVRSGTDPLAVTIQNNNISENAIGAIYFLPNNTTQLTLNISNNTIVNNTSISAGALGSSVVIDTNDTTIANCSLNVNNNVFSNNSRNAIYSHTSGGFNSITVNAVGNTVTNGGQGGFVFATPCNSTFNLTATDNIISNCNDNGIAVISGNLINTANINISKNQITGMMSSANGVAINNDANTLKLTLANNNISGNEGTGLIMYPPDGIEALTVTINNNTINNNQNVGHNNAAAGIDLEQFINLSGTITNNTLLNNISTDPNVYIASTEPSPNACITMTGNNSDTGYTLINDNGIFNLAPCNVDSVNEGAIGKYGTIGITEVQSCPGAVVCP